MENTPPFGKDGSTMPGKKTNFMRTLLASPLLIFHADCPYLVGSCAEVERSWVALRK
jgi:hypothetical protein